MQIDIFFNDLKEDLQQKILKIAGIDKPEKANFDVFPLGFIDITGPEVENND